MKFAATYDRNKLVQLLKTAFQSAVIIMLFISCEDQYIPELDSKYDSVLVVDGIISNAAPPYTIKLSKSSKVDASEFIPLTAYEVVIMDDQDNIEVLTESDAGTYLTSPDGIQGTVGRAYKIVIKSPQGKTYESDFEKMKTPVGIESVYIEVEYEEGIPGYQFYIDTQTAPGDTTYFLWSMDETYKFESDYLIYFYYDGVLHEFLNSDSLKTCWNSGKVYPFFVESTVGLSEPRFSQYPLHFVSTKTRQLSIRYSLFVNQYVISENAYEFWNGIKEQNAASGELYYSQPYQLRGNVFNTDEPDELVLGYFMVAGVSQKRIYVNRPDPPVEMLYTVCHLSQSDYEDYGWMFLGGPLATWPLYITVDGNGGRALPSQECIDCTKKGGTLMKPDFWED